jgi:outer membrane protein OmpA-like peptidoglycan-associated protein
VEVNMEARMTVVVAAIWLCSIGVASAQPERTSPAIASSDVLSQISMFSYEDGPKSDLFFRGTPIAANASGEVEVEYQDGNARIAAKVAGLPSPVTLGPYTDYVLWALTPDGRAVNLGVLTGVRGGKGSLDTTYGASQFALIVTAEPHFAVSAPSTMISLYNVADDVKGTETKVSTLVERADYSKIAPIEVSAADPIEVVQARYSVAIAGEAGADRYAAQTYETATQKLSEAQALGSERRSRDEAKVLAREATLAGEDATRAAKSAAVEAAAEAERQTALAAERERAETQARAAASAASAAATAAANQAARADLLRRLNAALPTRESERGMVSEIGGVQFATGRAELSAAARESLSRFAGIVASYPDIQFSVEGHTDNTGSVTTNEELSVRRALAVRDYLIAQGIGVARIDARGFAATQPIADNATSEGRARNRRVEIVLTGGSLFEGR